MCVGGLNIFILLYLIIFTIIHYCFIIYLCLLYYFIDKEFIYYLCQLVHTHIYKSAGALSTPVQTEI